jgi:thiamine-phosphate diphosphorylase / hydroxyethylthiazole kinase
VKTVAIGGLNASNASRVRFQSESSSLTKLNGVAVVSALMSAEKPTENARELSKLFRSTPTFVHSQRYFDPENLLESSFMRSRAAIILDSIKNETPLVHHLTNNVVKNFSANVTLAVGASPIMSEALPDIHTLANIPVSHACVLNLGTLTEDCFPSYYSTLSEYNKAGWPVILDPVGAGATSFRAEAVAECLERGYVDVLKGNLGEMMAVAGWEGGKSRGVDSIDAGDLGDRCRLAKFLALRESPNLLDGTNLLGNIAIITGKDDVISDGKTTIIISNGTALLGKITGVWCSFNSG